MPAYKKVNEERADGRTPNDYKYARKFLNQYSNLNGREIEVLLEISKVLGDDYQGGELPFGTLSEVANNLGLKYKRTENINGEEVEKEYNYASYVSQIRQRAAKKILHSYFTIYLLHSLGLMYIPLEDLQKELNKCKKDFQKAYINTLDPAYDLEETKHDQFLHAIMTQNIDAIKSLVEEPPESPFIKRVEEKLQKKHEELAAYELENEKQVEE